MATDTIARGMAKKAINNISPTGADIMITSGTYTKPSIVYNIGGTVTVGTGLYRCYKTTDFSGVMVETSLTGGTFSLPDRTTSYLIFNYNNGNPIMGIITDLSLINYSNVFAIFTVARVGDNFSFVDWDEPSKGLANKLLNRAVDTRRFERVNGLDLEERATRDIIISAGNIWQGVQKVYLDTCYSSVDTVFLESQINGVWSHTLITQYNNTQYNSPTGLTTLTDGSYAVNWIFRVVGSAKQVLVFLGDGDYDLNSAKSSQLPDNIPSGIASNAMLIGRMIVHKGDSNCVQIDGAFDMQFEPSTITNHSGLVGLIGGDSSTGTFYHSNQPINTTNDVAFNKVAIADSLTVGGIATITGNETVGGTLGVTGITVLSNNLIVSGTATLNGVETVNGIATFNENTEHATTKEDRFYNSGRTAFTSIDSPLIDGNLYPDFRVRTQAGLFYVDQDGKFGNTSNPTAELHVIGDAVITGDLDVQGEISYVNVTNLNVEDKNIYLLNTTIPTDTLADGGGLILNGTTDKTILWNQSTGNWTMNAGLTVDNTVQSVAGKSLVLNSTSTSIDLKIGGTTKATLTDTGLGIGTTAPFSLLSNTTTNVLGSDGSGVNNSSISWTLSNVGYVAGFFNSSTLSTANGLAVKVANNASTANALDISYGTSQAVTGKSLFNVKGNGKVGIGTTNPTFTLDIQGTRPNLQLKSTVATNEAYINFANNGEEACFYVGRNDSTGESLVTGGTAYAGVINMLRACPIQLATSDKVRMTILSGGSVGIGTVNPKATLHSTGTTILGCQNFGLEWANVGNGQMGIQLQESTNTLVFLIRLTAGAQKVVSINYLTGVVTTS